MFKTVMYLALFALVFAEDTSSELGRPRRLPRQLPVPVDLSTIPIGSTLDTVANGANGIISGVGGGVPGINLSQLPMVPPLPLQG